MKHCLFALILLLANSMTAELRFYREDLHFTLTESRFVIDGNYFFRNKTDKDLNQILYYPFPQDSLYGVVDTIFCENISRSDSAKVLGWNQKGASLQIAVPTQDTTVIYIHYEQLLKSGKAEYILSTTSTWGKGFEQASYDLIFPKYITIKSISYHPDELIETETDYKLIWQKENFLPIENFIVEFEKK